MMRRLPPGSVEERYLNMPKMRQRMENWSATSKKAERPERFSAKTGIQIRASE
jgi:hypothetical protein